MFFNPTEMKKVKKAIKGIIANVSLQMCKMKFQNFRLYEGFVYYALKSLCIIISPKILSNYKIKSGRCIKFIMDFFECNKIIK